MQRGEKKRQLHIDLLRILACLSVILLHTAAQYWYELPITGTRWLVCNAYDAVSRFGVPIFVMISGTLFLSREGQIPIAKLYKNNILRMFVAYWAWSIFYGIWDCREWIGMPGVTWKVYLSEVFYSRYHLWFLPMIIGIYMLLPVLKVFVDHASQQLLQYVLVIFLVLQVGANTLVILNPPQIIQNLLYLVDVEMICSYVAYFILGYYLCRYPVSDRQEKALYLLGVLGAGCAVVVSTWASFRNGGPSAAAYDSFSLFTFLVSVAIFVFFQKRVSVSMGEGNNRLIGELSANTFGVYLVHLWVLEYLQMEGFDSMTLNNIIGIPLLTLVCFLICNVIVTVLRRIPVVGRYVC